MILERQARRVAEFVHEHSRNRSLQSIDAIVGDLLSVNSEEQSPQSGRFHKITYSSRGNGVLIFQTEPIVLEGVNLGAFDIRIRLTGIKRSRFPHAGGYVFIDALTPHPHSGGCPHPHVNGDSLCFGAGGGAADNAYARGDIVSLARIANAVLHVYNPDSPYRRIGYYNGPACVDCDGIVTLGDPYLQDGKGTQCVCGSSVCGDCVQYCKNERCNYKGCPNCVNLASITPQGETVYCCRRCGATCNVCRANIVPMREEFIIMYRGYTRYRCTDCASQNRTL